MTKTTFFGVQHLKKFMGVKLPLIFKKKTLWFLMNGDEWRRTINTIYNTWLNTMQSGHEDNLEAFGVAAKVLQKPIIKSYGPYGPMIRTTGSSRPQVETAVRGRQRLECGLTHPQVYRIWETYHEWIFSHLFSEKLRLCHIGHVHRLAETNFPYCSEKSLNYEF